MFGFGFFYSNFGLFFCYWVLGFFFFLVIGFVSLLGFWVFFSVIFVLPLLIFYFYSSVIFGFVLS